MSPSLQKYRREVLSLVNDRLSELAPARGKSRKLAYFEILKSIPLDPTTSRPYKRLQLMQLLSSTCKEYAKYETANYNDFLLVGSAYLKWQDDWGPRLTNEMQIDQDLHAKLLATQTRTKSTESLASPDSDILLGGYQSLIKIGASLPSEARITTRCETSSTISRPVLDRSSTWGKPIGDTEITSTWKNLAVKIQEASDLYLKVAPTDAIMDSGFLFIEDNYEATRELLRDIFAVEKDAFVDSKLGHLGQPIGRSSLYRAVMARGMVNWVFENPELEHKMAVGGEFARWKEIAVQKPG
jgi:hypothetical protein